MTLREEKDSLIGIIKYYRDEYHRQDFGHTAMIAEVETATESNQLEDHWRRTDDWFDWSFEEDETG